MILIRTDQLHPTVARCVWFSYAVMILPSGGLLAVSAPLGWATAFGVGMVLSGAGMLVGWWRAGTTVHGRARTLRRCGAVLALTGVACAELVLLVFGLEWPPQLAGVLMLAAFGCLVARIVVGVRTRAAMRAAQPG